MTTGAPSNVTDNSAMPSGSVNPNGLPTSAYFEWGTTTAYGSSTPAQSLAAGTTSTPVVASLDGLARNTTYHFRIVATNGAGTAIGADMSSSTSAVSAGSVTLTVMVCGAGGVSGSGGVINCPAAGCTATYAVGTPITLLAVPRSGHTLTQWNGACAGSATTCGLTLTADQSVTATFTGAIFTDGSGPNSAITGASGGGATVIKAVHIVELRSAINGLRAVKALPAFDWTDPTLTVGSTIARRIHVLELRTALAAVCALAPANA